MSQIVFDCNTLQYTSNHNPIFTNPEGVQSQITVTHVRTAQSQAILVPKTLRMMDYMKKHSHQCIGATGSVLAPEATPTAKFIFAWCNPGVSLKPSKSCLSH